jgi:FAD/FMN-containing dehydrogenase
VGPSRGRRDDQPRIPERALSELQLRLTGKVIVPGDVAYDQARAVWNARIARRPGAIVRVTSPEDAAVGLEIARSHGLRLCVRGGGHSVTGHSVVDDGLLLDLVGLDELRIDPGRKVAWLGGGLTWGPVDAAIAEHGLAMTGGQISTTGVGGLTLGGGVGWLMGLHGLTVDHLRSVELVDADGRLRRVSAKDDPELFWALRGGGGNFGIVTRFELDLHQLGPILAGTLIHPIERAADVIRLFAEVSTWAPDELTIMVLLLGAPDQPHIPPELRGRSMALLAPCWAGDLDRGEEVLRPIRAFGPPLVDRVRRMPYPELQAMFDFGSRPGFRNYWRSPFIRPLDEAAIQTIAAYGSGIPTAGSQVLLTNMGGAVARAPDEATAFGHRGAAGYLEIIGKWADGEDGASAIAWADAFADAIEPATTGYAYVNFLDEGEPGGVGRAYPPATLRRLALAKRRYDPDNVFRSNHNIPPAIGRAGEPRA